MNAIHTEKAPAAIGPYSQAIEVNGFVYTSGQLPVDPATGEFAEGGIKEQTRQSLTNIRAILEEGGYAMDDIVKTTVLLNNIRNFGAMNAVYAEFFPDMKPARACYQVAALPMGAKVEIEAIAGK